MAYFNAELLPDAENAYVCFMDIMGMQNKMKYSLSQSGNYVFKLHATILEAWRKSTYNSISVYPIMDGAYIVSKQKEDLLDLLASILMSLCKDLINQHAFYYWYLVRAAIAYGEIIQGRDIPYTASYEYYSRVGYKEQLLIGPAMIKAYEKESCAAPMGIYVTDSAISAEQSIAADWKWFNQPKVLSDVDRIDAFKNKLKTYYSNWLEENEEITGYKKDRRDAHFQLAKEYFEIE